MGCHQAVGPMRDVHTVIAEAQRWLARGHGSWAARYPDERTLRLHAPLLFEALTNGPLADDTLMDALSECADTADEAATRLVGHLLTLSEDDRDLVTAQLAEGRG